MLSEPSDPLVGTVLLGRYRIERVLGEGGMGKVYLATQKMGKAQRKVAIKTLQKSLSHDPQIVARFHRECETVIELHHPNTVKFYDFGEMEDGTLFIVMEFIEGGDLAAHLEKNGPVDAALADRLIVQICGSLHEAHESGVVHRDLKPENVLLTKRGGQKNFVKVLDFGIAKRSEAEDKASAKLTQQGTVLGTPPYMSPEQFSGQTLDLRSDIYSLGVMTYEMITGRLPFEANTPWEWATKHLTAQPTPIENYPQGAALPPNKRNAIMRAMAKDKGQRQENAIAFMQEFTGMGDPQMAWTVATGTGVTSGTASPPGSMGPASGGFGSPTPLPGGFGASTPTPPPGGYGTGTPTPHPGFADPSHGGQALSAPSKRSGVGKLLAIGTVAVLLLVGIPIGLWATGFFDDDAVADSTPINTGPNTQPPNVGQPNMNPNTGQNLGQPNMNPNTGQNLGQPIGQPIAPANNLGNQTGMEAGVNNTDTSQMTSGMSTMTGQSLIERQRAEEARRRAEAEAAAAEAERLEAERREAERRQQQADSMRQSTMMSQMTAQMSQDSEEDAGMRALQAASIFARQGRISQAVRSLQSAQRFLGRNHSGIAPVRSQISAASGPQVTQQIQTGQCGVAAQNIAALESIGLGRSLRRQLINCR